MYVYICIHYIYKLKPFPQHFGVGGDVMEVTFTHALKKTFAAHFEYFSNHEYFNSKKNFNVQSIIKNEV